MERQIKLRTIKENYELGNNIASKVLAFAFGLAAEIERELISQRTREALMRRKSEGKALGRPRGQKSVRVKLSKHEDDIISLINEGVPKARIAKKFNVARGTLSRFLSGISSGYRGKKPAPAYADGKRHSEFMERVALENPRPRLRVRKNPKEKQRAGEKPSKANLRRRAKV